MPKSIIVNLAGPLLTKKEEFSLKWEEKTVLMIERARERQRFCKEESRKAAREVSKWKQEIEKLEQEIRCNKPLERKQAPLS